MFDQLVLGDFSAKKFHGFCHSQVTFLAASVRFVETPSASLKKNHLKNC
jgi:hypothetical protein